ncbi:hypothetical protein [Streptomyces naphthomycinicus]|uniref:hypothetical protein n=1 Tax=Streptomyces naphthomycinicus TaxID=2872625 RepID=UPI001CED0F38|nr:hypothetical protein [Streptomyces sp. TML10]
MGERHSGDGPPGRRSAHPDGTVAAPDRGGPSGGISGPEPGGISGLESRFGAALRAGDVDPEAERGALAAFRAAREAGTHDARTRARDDWRPGRPVRARRSLRTTLSLALASLTVGGVAVAAIGSAGSGADDGGRTASRSARPSASAPLGSAGPAAPADGLAARPSDTGSAGRSTPPAPPAPPATARDTLAHCRAWAQAGKGGGALEATAWQRLVAAAGGRENVAAYCAARTAPAREKDTGATGGSGTARRGADKGADKGGGNGKTAGGRSAGGKH